MQGVLVSTDSFSEMRVEILNEYIRIYKLYNLSLETLFMAILVFNRFT